jgi:hypothetical protein
VSTKSFYLANSELSCKSPLLIWVLIKGIVTVNKQKDDFLLTYFLLQEGGFPIPVGSCQYDLSQILSVIAACPDACPPGQQNSLPLMAGHYQGNF